MSEANQRQVGGNHYKKHGANGEQHWDRIARLYGEHAYIYFVGCITKYVERFRDKGGIQDLEKARHYLDKLIEVEQQRVKTEQCPNRTEGQPHYYQLMQTPVGSGWRCIHCGTVETTS